MTIIVQDDGFTADDWSKGYRTVDDLAAGTADTKTPIALDLGAECDVLALPPLPANTKLVRVAFPAFTDGRGFTIARLLRLKGYKGRLRAHGNLLADQYTMLRRCGFDEVEISQDLARRQPQDQWRARANWKANDYQSGLRQFI